MYSYELTESRGGYLISNAEVGTTNHGIDSREMVLVNAPSISVEDSPPPIHRASHADVYRFAHDRVQQAAALLLNPEDTLKTHVKLAEVSTSLSPSKLVLPNIFDNFQATVAVVCT